MKLKEIKKATLALLDEYIKENPFFTNDEDIRDNLNILINQAQYDLFLISPIYKTFTPYQTQSINGYFVYDMPLNFYNFYKTHQLKPDVIDFFFIGKKLYVKDTSSLSFVLEYIAYPEYITEDTDEEMIIDLPDEYLMCIPYIVVSDILKTDPSADYKAFESRYIQRMNIVKGMNKINPVIVVESSYDYTY